MPLDVTSGEKIYISSCRFICAYKDTSLSASDGVNNNSPLYKKYIYIVPGDVTRIVITGYTEDIDTFIISKSEKAIDYIPYGQIYIDPLHIPYFNKDALSGLSCLNFGDSIAENRSESKSYSVQTCEKINGSLLHDYALGGSTMSYIEGQSMGCIYKQVETQCTTYPSDKPDFILINGGANDKSNSRTIGDVVKTNNHYEMSDYTADFDTTTYIGAMEKAISLLKSTYSDSVIIFVTPHKHDRLTDEWEEMMNKAREVCAKWSISIVDMDKESQLNSRLPYMRTKYTDEGGTHQNTEGNKKYYLPKIIAELRRYFN